MEGDEMAFIMKESEEDKCKFTLLLTGPCYNLEIGTLEYFPGTNSWGFTLVGSDACFTGISTVCFANLTDDMRYKESILMHNYSENREQIDRAANAELARWGKKK